MITGVGELIVRVRASVPVPFALVAPKVTVKVPVSVGVPLIAPVLVLTARPEGNPVA